MECKCSTFLLLLYLIGFAIFWGSTKADYKQNKTKNTLYSGLSGTGGKLHLLILAGRCANVPPSYSFYTCLAMHIVWGSAKALTTKQNQNTLYSGISGTGGKTHLLLLAGGCANVPANLLPLHLFGFAHGLGICKSSLQNKTKNILYSGISGTGGKSHMLLLAAGCANVPVSYYSLHTLACCTC